MIGYKYDPFASEKLLFDIQRYIWGNFIFFFFVALVFPLKFFFPPLHYGKKKKKKETRHKSKSDEKKSQEFTKKEGGKKKMSRKNAILAFVLVLVLLLVAGIIVGLSFTWPWITVPMSSAAEYDCVVSAYRENLDWLKTYLPGNPNIIVYSKHKETSGQFLNTVDLPNVGRCDHSYLYHIVNHYDHLAPVTLFTTASAFALKHKKAILDMIILPRIGSKGYKCLGNTSIVYGDFAIEEYQATSQENKATTNKVALAIVRPFSAWWKHYFPTISLPVRVVLSGVFAATREAIHATPLETWQELMKQHEVADSCEVGHYMERSWFRLLTLKTETQKTKETE